AAAHQPGVERVAAAEAGGRRGEESGGDGEREGDRGCQGREAQTHGIPEGRGGGGDGSSPGAADAAYQTHAAGAGAAAAADRVPASRRSRGSGTE
ncbi:unnamed protein product, partial [Ectocarpus sp. 12 AP-2014]